MVVTALKASCDTVPGWGKVIKRLLQEEKQLKENAEAHALRTKGESQEKGKPEKVHLLLLWQARPGMQKVLLQSRGKEKL